MEGFDVVFLNTTRVKDSDKVIILKNITEDFSQPFNYCGCAYNNKEDLFKHVPFEGFCDRADNIRYLYTETKKELPKWFDDAYSWGFYPNGFKN